MFDPFLDIRTLCSGITNRIEHLASLAKQQDRKAVVQQSKDIVVEVKKLCEVRYAPYSCVRVCLCEVNHIQQGYEKAHIQSYLKAHFIQTGW